MRAHANNVNVYGSFGLSGCGDITGWDANGDPIVDTASCSAGIPGTENTSWPTSPVNTTNGTTAGSTANVASILSSLTNSFTNIFKAVQPLPQGCTQVAGPYGVSTQCAGTGAQPSLSLSSMGGSSSLLLIGGAVLVAIMVLKK